jgi:hypothetical protein
MNASIDTTLLVALSRSPCNESGAGGDRIVRSFQRDLDIRGVDR